MELDGDMSVSGIIPDKSVTGILLPGYVNDRKRVIQALGGEETVSSLVRGEIETISLRMRPEDPFCHPALSARGKQKGLLLRMKACGRENNIEAEVTAVVEKTVGFPFMADFQYRAPQGMSTLSAGFVDYFKGSGGAGEDIEPEDMFGDAEGLCMIPPIFSRIDAPVDVLGHGYGASTKAQRGRKRRAPRDAARQAQEDAMPFLTEEELRERTMGVERVPGDAAAEEVAQRQGPSHESAGELEAGERTTERALALMLAERSVWTKGELEERAKREGIDVESGAFRWAVQSACYTFSTGPFVGCLVARGTDPRADQNAAQWQGVVCRAAEGGGEEEETQRERGDGAAGAIATQELASADRASPLPWWEVGHSASGVALRCPRCFLRAPAVGASTAGRGEDAQRWRLDTMPPSGVDIVSVEEARRHLPSVASAIDGGDQRLRHFSGATGWWTAEALGAIAAAVAGRWSEAARSLLAAEMPGGVGEAGEAAMAQMRDMDEGE